MKTLPIVVEAILNAPVHKVWAALTHHRQMQQWYFDIEEFIAEYGAEFEFYGGTPERQYLHKCKITDLVQDQKIGYDWKYDGVEGDSHVTFEIHPEEGHKTKLRLVHSGTETFPTYDTNFSRTSFENGWNEIINSNLRNYLES